MLSFFKDPLPLYRIAHCFYKSRIPLIPSFITYFIRFFWAAFVPYTAIIGEGTKLGYGGLCVVIHKDAKIGKNCIISQGVTIGGTGTRDGVPEIGDNVILGAGAKIIGPIKIGNSAVIGANAVVTKDVHSMQVVGGIPARVIKGA